MNFTTAGSLIRQSRRQAKLTQADLAKRLGMSRTTISQVETGIPLCDQKGFNKKVLSRIF